MLRMRHWVVSAVVVSSLLFASSAAPGHAQTAAAIPQKVADLKMAVRDLFGEPHLLGEVTGRRNEVRRQDGGYGGR